jgi:hypothetical protein
VWGPSLRRLRLPHRFEYLPEQYVRVRLLDRMRYVAVPVSALDTVVRLLQPKVSSLTMRRALRRPSCELLHENVEWRLQSRPLNPLP